MPHDSNLASPFIGNALPTLQEANACDIRQAVIDAAMRFLNKYAFPLKRDGFAWVIDWQMPHKKITSIFSAANEAEFDKVTRNATKKYLLVSDDSAVTMESIIKCGCEEAISVYIALTQKDMDIDQDYISMRANNEVEMTRFGALSPLNPAEENFPKRVDLAHAI